MYFHVKHKSKASAVLIIINDVYVFKLIYCEVVKIVPVYLIFIVFRPSFGIKIAHL